MPRVARWLLLLALGVTLARPSAAQRFLPGNVSAFELPIASPRGTGFIGRIVGATTGDSRFGSGRPKRMSTSPENIPIFLLTKSRRPWILDFGVGTQARFSLTDPKSALISNDWTVGFDVQGHIHRTAVALELYHESSHLGDEYADHFNAPRIDWTREIAMGWVGFPIGQVTFRGGAGYVLVDQLGLKPGLATFAIDYRGRDGIHGGMAGRLVMGFITEAAQATSWHLSSSARIALELGPMVGHRFAVGVVAHRGLSTQRQFYLASSRYYGLEIRFNL